MVTRLLNTAQAIALKYSAGGQKAVLLRIRTTNFMDRARRSAGSLRFHMKMYAVYLLYWYKSTNTDAPCFTGVFVPADYIFEAQVRYA
jgi:hypothetical protein